MNIFSTGGFLLQFWRFQRIKSRMSASYSEEKYLETLNICKNSSDSSYFFLSDSLCFIRNRICRICVGADVTGKIV